MAKQNWVEAAKAAEGIGNFLERIKDARKVFADVLHAERTLVLREADIDELESDIRKMQEDAARKQTVATRALGEISEKREKLDASLEAHKEETAGAKAAYDDQLAMVRERGELVIKNLNDALESATAQHSEAIAAMVAEEEEVRARVDTLKAQQEEMVKIVKGFAPTDGR